MPDYTSQNLIFRRAETQDVPAIVHLVQSVYRGDTSKQGWTSEADILGGQRTDNAMIAELLAQPQGVFLLAEQGGELLGSVYLEREPTAVYLGMLSVNVKAQNLKLGRRMIEESEKWAWREWNVSETRITVISIRHELIAWYERRGFQLTGKTEEFPKDPRFGIPKVENLVFVELKKTMSL